MTRNPYWIALAMLMMLGACSPEGEDNRSASGNGMIVNENAVAKAPDNQTVTIPSDENQAGVGEAQQASTIPTALRGRWGMVKNDCTSLHGDAKGLLEISASRLDFYESRGTLAKISEIEPTRVRATFDFEGEGQSWQRDVLLEVQDSGQSLVRREYGEGVTAQTAHYTRCGR